MFNSTQELVKNCTFEYCEQTGQYEYYNRDSMTLRDHYAGLAITNHPLNLNDVKAISEYAYKLADEMLKERLRQ